jgi:hypothetical protein
MTMKKATKPAGTKAETMDAWSADDTAPRQNVAAHSFTERGIPSPFNFRGITGDIGAIMDAIAESDPDRVPVAIVRAGRRFAFVMLTEDMPQVRYELAAQHVALEKERALKVEGRSKAR